MILMIALILVFLEEEDNIANIGKFSMIERKVDLNADIKRLWFEELRNINEQRLIGSLPISLNHFTI